MTTTPLLQLGRSFPNHVFIYFFMYLFNCLFTNLFIYLFIHLFYEKKEEFAQIFSIEMARHSYPNPYYKPLHTCLEFLW